MSFRSGLVYTNVKADMESRHEARGNMIKTSILSRKLIVKTFKIRKNVIHVHVQT